MTVRSTLKLRERVWRNGVPEVPVTGFVFRTSSFRECAMDVYDEWNSPLSGSIRGAHSAHRAAQLLQGGTQSRLFASLAWNSHIRAVGLQSMARKASYRYMDSLSCGVDYVGWTHPDQPPNIPTESSQTKTNSWISKTVRSGRLRYIHSLLSILCCSSLV